jgi:2-dehydro-3-deoxygluconokinase
VAKLVTFGEIMGRLAAPDHLRLRQALPGRLEVTFAGAEANVAVGFTQLGGTAAFVTALPHNPIADACLDTLRGLGVDTSAVLRTDAGRVGLYFLETGANQRPSQVTYDREGAAISLTPADRYPWAQIFQGAHWLHVSGITPALSRMAAEAVVAAVQAARAQHLRVSCDLNFRGKLWRWDPPAGPRQLAERTLRAILPQVDVVIANEEDAADVLSIRAKDTDVQAGRLAADRYREVAGEIVRQFPQVRTVGITLRESLSATHNNWGAMLFDAASGQAYFAPLREGRYEPYAITSIVDRLGAGDAFAAGLIYALMTPELSDPQTAVAFAAANSCLAHSIAGDFCLTSRAEVEALLRSRGSGRVVR